jgi:nucleotidyltransferase substrate binding protein (TIGR01987 family)
MITMTTETINYENLRQAITSLEKTLGALTKVGSDPDVIDGLKAGVIQNFEFTYELAWKCIAKWLTQNTPDPSNINLPKKQLFRLAADYQLITSQQQWFDFNASRNLTSHRYDGSIVDDKVTVAKNFIPVVKELLTRLETL